MVAGPTLQTQLVDDGTQDETVNAEEPLRALLTSGPEKSHWFGGDVLAGPALEHALWLC